MPTARPLIPPLPRRRRELVVGIVARSRRAAAAPPSRISGSLGVALAFHAALALFLFYVRSGEITLPAEDDRAAPALRVSRSDSDSDSDSDARHELAADARPPVALRIPPDLRATQSARIPSTIRPNGVPLPEIALPLPVSPDSRAGWNQIMAQEMARLDLSPAAPTYGGHFFGKPVGTGTVIVVLDVSASMAKAPQREQIRQQALDLIGGLAPDQGFNVIAFAQDADMLFRAPQAATAANKSAAVAFLSGYHGGGIETTRTGAGMNPQSSSGVRFVPVPASRVAETRHWLGPTRLDLGILLALKQHPDTILALTDGRPRIHGILVNPSDDEVVAALASASRQHYPPPIRPTVHSYLFPHSRSARPTDALPFLHLMERHLGATVTVIP